MTRNTKIALSILAGLFVVSVCVCIGALVALRQLGQAVGDTFEGASDPTKAAEVGARIADYRVPQGYQQMGMNLFGFEMVMLTPDLSNSGMAILLMQFPSGANMDPEQMEAQMEEAMRRQMGTSGSFEVIDSFDVTIRGQEVTLLVQEGASDQGYSLIQVTGYFEGKEGPAMISFYSGPDDWDQAVFESFIASMK